MRRGRVWWLTVLGALACSDDAGPATNLDGGLDGGRADVDGSQVDDGSRGSRDGASVDSRTPEVATCVQRSESFVVPQPAYHREGTISYPDPPPVGGDHNPCWGKWGVYDAAKPLPVERWVHNLEHGGVVYLYNCPEGCAPEVAQLATFVKGRQQALLTPYAALPTRFAVVSWGERITSDCFDVETLQSFYTAHVNQGPEQIASNPPDSCL